MSEPKNTGTAKPTLGQLEAEALKRRERLKSLKRKATTRGSETEDNDNGDNLESKASFRNYTPANDETITKATLKSTSIKEDIETEVENYIALSKTPMKIEEIDLSNLAPRKPDWDLKRDIEQKLTKLERRTQRAIAQIIRNRLKSTEQIYLESMDDNDYSKNVTN